MASALKLTMEELYVDEFQLIAIHTSLEDYRLAYFLNQSLSIKLKKCEDDLQVKSKKGESNFSRFEYENDDLCHTWNLIENKINISNVVVDLVDDLFSSNQNLFTTNTFLLPEFKNVDFLLKINKDEAIDLIPNYISKINAIEKVSLVYVIENYKIKTKNNLIF
jgi:hydroxymethylpyrimidine pyrophosphatase-like HAD family hydrolase